MGWKYHNNLQGLGICKYLQESVLNNYLQEVVELFKMTYLM